MTGPTEWDLLAPFLTEERRSRLEEVLARRTAVLRLVAEDLYDAHNLSAILRTAEAFGIQHVHLAGSAPGELNPRVALGAERWLTVERERDAPACLARLKGLGYTIAAAAPGGAAADPLSWEPPGPVALVVGNEHAGLSAAALAAADVVLRIPTTGFTRSLNVSVSAALLIHVLLRKRAGRDCPLSPEEQEALRRRWVVQAVPHGKAILKKLRGEGDG